MDIPDRAVETAQVPNSPSAVVQLAKLAQLQARYVGHNVCIIVAGRWRSVLCQYQPRKVDWRSPQRYSTPGKLVSVKQVSHNPIKKLNPKIQPKNKTFSQQQ